MSLIMADLEGPLVPTNGAVLRQGRAFDPTACEKVDVPGDIALNITRIEGDQTVRFHEHKIHVKALKHLNNFLPGSACLLDAIRPELKQKLEGRIFVQNAFCAS